AGNWRRGRRGGMISAACAAGTTRSLTYLSAVQPRRQVAVTRVREHRDDHAVPDRAGKPSHRPKSRPARVADEKPFGASHLASEIVGRLGRASPYLVSELGGPDPGHDRGRKVLQALEAVKGVLGLHGDRSDRWIVLLQAARRPHKRSRRPEAGHE